MTNEPLTIELNEQPKPNKSTNNNQRRRTLLQQSPDHPDDYILAIDHSSLESFNVCARKAEYALVQKRQPVRNTSALSYGTAVHKAIETMLRVDADQRENPVVVGKVQSDIISHYGENPVPMDEWRTAERALETVAKYRKQFANDVFEVLEVNGNPMVEVPFALPLGMVELNQVVKYDPLIVTGAAKNDDDTPCQHFYVRNIHILWSGRIDAIIVMDGRIWVMDHKTSSMGGAGFTDQFFLSSQTIGYTWAAQELLRAAHGSSPGTFANWSPIHRLEVGTSIDVSGLLLNGIITRKPTRTGVGNEFVRQRYRYEPAQLDEWKHNTLTLVSDFLSHLCRGFFPMQTAWCINKYGRCPYFEVCQLPAQQRERYLSSNIFEPVTWSPLAERE